MRQKHRRLVAAILGTAIVAAVAVPLLGTNPAAAKLLSWVKQNKEVKAIEPEQSPEISVKGTDTSADIDINSEAVVIGKDGQSKRLSIISVDNATLEQVTIDKVAAAQLQESVNEGHQPWLLDPVQVVQNYGSQYGFDAQQDTFTLVYQLYKGRDSGTGEAVVLVQHGAKSYLVKLIQPAGPGEGNIWQINSVREVKTVEHRDKIDVGPGVEGLDYPKVIKWQQNVDEGRELWRLDPLQVARNEGKAYGFSEDDDYAIVSREDSSPIARHGQINIQVTHQGKIYNMILVRPFGSDDGAIWTIYQVNPVADPQPPTNQPGPRILFDSDKYAAWKWYKGAYPQDMAFAVIADYEAQLKQDKRIPEFVLSRVKNVDYSSKVVLLAYFGQGSGADGIGIEKVTLTGNSMVVQVRTRSVKPGEFETKMITNPSDYVVLDRNIVDIWGGMNITFVDQNGQVLSKNRLVVDHHGRER